MIRFTPETNYTNYYNVARFNLTWRLNLILLIFLPILAITLINIGENAAYPTLIGVGLSITVTIILIKTKSYLFSAILYAIVGVVLSLYTLLFFPESYHFVDSAWMMIIILYTYFTLGKVWGTISLLSCLTGIVYFILFILNTNLELTRNLGFEDALALAINYFICGIIISYMIFQFLKLNEYAEKQYIKLTTSLKEKNEEKSILLKEVHHRVKNNLQIIISLLRLQSIEVEDEQTDKVLKEMVNRIRSMSLIHEKIYQTDDFANINLEDYLIALIKDLIASNSVDSKIIYKITSDLNSVNIKSLVPMALIFNELISNSIKHAFKGLSEGFIKIDIKTEGDTIKIVYADNGTWVEPTKSSLGLELIDSLCLQLSGQFSRNTSNGTQYNFEFEHNLPK